MRKILNRFVIGSFSALLPFLITANSAFACAMCEGGDKKYWIWGGIGMLAWFLIGTLLLTVTWNKVIAYFFKVKTVQFWQSFLFVLTLMVFCAPFHSRHMMGMHKMHGMMMGHPEGMMGHSDGMSMSCGHHGKEGAGDCGCGGGCGAECDCGCNDKK